jgi:hypothetical protein
MRTSTLSNTSRGEVVSLSDVTAAIADAAHLRPSDQRLVPAGSALGVSSSLKLAIPAALLASSLKSLDTAMSNSHPTEPMFSPKVSDFLSRANAFVKRSGSMIEKALGASFEQCGFVVFPQVAMPISDAARFLVVNNDVAKLKDVSVAADAPTSGRMTVFDLLVYNPATRVATLIEVKRGNGTTEARKTGPIGETLQAGGLQVKALLKARGLKVRRVDAKVIDYYGHSGFHDDLRITGDQLDAYFKAPVRGMVEALLTEVSEQARRHIRPLLESALAELVATTQAPLPAQSALLTLPNGLRVRPEHMGSIEVRRIPRRFKLKGGFKANGAMIALAGTACTSSNPRTTPL